MTTSEELIVGGLKVAAVEKRYDAKYVGYYSIPGTGDGPFVVFYRETLNEHEIANKFDNYFGLYRKSWNDDVIIFNAKKIRDAEFAAIEVAPGEFICSRSVHNNVSHPSGAWLDGGPFYTRCSPDHRPTHVMRIVDGKEVFTPNARVISPTPSAGVAPSVPNVIDAEFTEVAKYQANGITAILADVAAFHTAVDQPVRIVPAFPSQDEIDFRIRLIDEEYNVEFKEACEKRDIVAAADALADIMYVVIGTALHFGLSSTLDRCWQEVQSSNMAKVDPETGKVRKRADGKVLKPEGWQPPNIRLALGILEPEILS